MSRRTVMQICTEINACMHACIWLKNNAACCTQAYRSVHSNRGGKKDFRQLFSSEVCSEWGSPFDVHIWSNKMEGYLRWSIGLALLQTKMHQCRQRQTASNRSSQSRNQRGQEDEVETVGKVKAGRVWEFVFCQGQQWMTILNLESITRVFLDLHLISTLCDWRWPWSNMHIMMRSAQTGPSRPRFPEPTVLLLSVLISMGLFVRAICRQGRGAFVSAAAVLNVSICWV